MTVQPRNLLRAAAVAAALTLSTIHPTQTPTPPTPTATAPAQMRIGVDFLPGDLPANLADYPQLGYHRHFGKDGSDADTLPELPNTRTDARWLSLPPSAVLHVSWKDDVEALNAWLSTVDRNILLTWYHEPMGDVPPTTYRQTATRMVQIIANHPNRARILGNGPILTGWWLEEKRGNPADWWYPGATFFGVDSYKPRAMASYPSGSYMFGRALTFAQSKGVPLVVGELGSELVPGDTGPGRAQALRGWITYLRDTGTCTFVGWWNIGGDRFSAATPHELATLQTAVHLLAP